MAATTVAMGYACFNTTDGGTSMKRWGTGLLGLALCCVAAAQTADTMSGRTEASLLVNGHILLTQDGTVSSFDLDHQDQLPPPVLDLIKRNAAKWRFEPVLENGAPVAAKAPMHLRVVATPSADGHTFQLRIARATFTKGGYEHGVTYKDHSAVPHYPEAAIRANIGGTVFLVLRIQRDGTVGDAAAEQVNLDRTGSEGIMRQWRNVLAESSIRVARKWVFNPPTGPHQNDDGWIIRVPITYSLQTNETRRPQDVAWQVYSPGPKEPIPWLDEYRRTHKEASAGTDALPDGLYLVGDDLHLISALDPS